MILTYLMLAVALCLSAVAAFYSIVGLTAIFAAAVIPIVIMGSILEAAKLVVTVWLHEYWHQIKLSMKLYLVPAVFILMVITSMGIFGFLSKAHTDQALVSGDAGAKLAIVDEKIRIERENIANARAVIQQMDAAVTGVITTGDQEIKLKDGSSQIRSAAERSLQIRRSQARDRDALTQQIEAAQTRIVRLQEESAPMRAEFRKVEAEVGPIKYIAALIYGDNPDANLLERAVRWVIIILVMVFDPLAVMMLLAFTESLRWERQRRAQQPPAEEKKHDISPASEPPADPVVAGPAQQEPDAGPHPDQPPDSDPPDAQQPDPGDNLPIRSDGPDADQPQPDHQPDRVDVRFVDEFHEPDWEERPGDYRDTPPVEPAPAQPRPPEERPFMAGRRGEEKFVTHDEDLPEVGDAFTWGSDYPVSPLRGDLFLRTDTLPMTLYKYNGTKWITVDKNNNDRYTYDEQYVDFLIGQISAGQYDPDLLTDSERSQIETRLRRDSE